MKFKFLAIFVVFLMSGCAISQEDQSFMENLKITKLQNYVYSISYNDYDNATVPEFMKKYDFSDWGCSGVSYGNFVGRNFDFPYDEMAQFVIKVDSNYARHASVGTAFMPELTNEIVSKNKYNENFHFLPFFTIDGINDAGVVILANTVPAGDNGTTFGTKSKMPDLNIYNVVRYVLDNADSVDHAIKLLRYKNIYSPQKSKKELHFMIADGKKSVVVEFVKNEMKVKNAKFVTNFYLTTQMTPHAQGIERFNLLKKNYKLGKTQKGMIELMKKVHYSHLYDKNLKKPWYSEYNGVDEETGEEGLTIQSSVEDYEPYIWADRKAFKKKKRNGSVWMTLHTSVFDIQNRKMTFIPYEQKRQYTFRVKK